MSFSRRHVLAGALLPFVGVQRSRAAAEDPAAIAAWMDAWMSAQKATLGNLNLGRFVEPIYYLLKPTIWLPDKGQEQLKSVNVPVGFVTDFASIPRIFWSLLPPDGKYTHPAIVHDYNYWTQTRPREDADQILKIMMEDFSVGAATTTAIYSAVRTFGGRAWDSNAKLKANGERRILSKFPEDPLTTWEDWKKRPDVFAPP
jgi:Protein of unknown function (DUF1353)